ncbi:response regulator [Herbaspirillum sp.]|uniref:response regulator n=1 Tax=Herbaspirillum sp. TaxID=1890675 RepID=UPI001B25F753|nr:response regulator [Herbaspirillum sp.]MBO9537362.1 response regulator [Herbaspirillum sp.]
MEIMKIMVVDDSAITVRKLSMMLESLGHRIIATAANGKEAIEAYRKYRPDVVTMDITMPEMDGIEATSAIIGEFPDAKIVMVTSHGQEKMVLDALKVGAKGYVIKPFQEIKVYEAIEKACKRVVIQEKLLAEIEQRKMLALQRDAAALAAQAVIDAEADERSAGQ